MLKKYNSEIQGMIDFWSDIGLEPDYDLNTDGRYAGNLVEFKLVFQDIRKHKEQVAKYIKAYNSSALAIPKYSYLISINDRKYIKINNESHTELKSGTWSIPNDFLSEFVEQDEYIRGWIDENSIVAYNNKLCKENSKIIKTKEDVKNEFIDPHFLNIKPFDWDKQIDNENSMKNEIGWLHFNMNMLGPSLLKKQLGAYFTPDMYVKISTEMVRNAIKKLPKENDYIIFDRCAGTGNLERYFHEDELSHCVLNTYDYTEWTTLKGLYEGRVRMIIPPTSKSIDESNGLLKYGDALSEEFMLFCKGKLDNSYDNEYRKQSKQLAKWLNDPKVNIIMYENPPFVEPQADANKGVATFEIKDKFLYKEMGKEKFDTKNTNRASENLFIWSAFKYFLKSKYDSYILFSPIKYWKSQHIIDKKYVKGYLCNRENFNASEACVPLIHWQNIDSNNELLVFNSDLGNRVVKKIHSNPLPLMVDSKNKKSIALMVNLSNMPKADNGKLTNYISDSYRKVQKAYLLGTDNVLNMIPLWVANCYKGDDYTEKELLMKTSDGKTKYQRDLQFLIDCFLWAGITNDNKCISNSNLTNQYCFGQSTISDSVLKGYDLNDAEENLLNAWNKVLRLAKKTDEYNANYKYGLFQIEKELNISIPSGTYNKKGDEILKPKYDKLDEAIGDLKDIVKVFYSKQIKKKLLKYELIK